MNIRGALHARALTASLTPREKSVEQGRGQGWADLVPDSKIMQRLGAVDAADSKPLLPRLGSTHTSTMIPVTTKKRTTTVSGINVRLFNLKSKGACWKAKAKWRQSNVAYIKYGAFH